MKSKLAAILLSTLLVAGCNDTSEPEVAQTPTETETIAETDPPSDSTEPAEPADPLAEFDMEKADRLTNTAKFLAGLPVEGEGAIAQRQNTAAWQTYANSMESSWSQLETQQISKARTWAQEELQALNEQSPQLFYPFSGPDFLYAYTFFPNATKYVMVGLEPVESVPDIENLSEGQLAGEIENIRKSLYAILQFSFFRTKDMAVDLDRQGVLPILFVFLARTNNQILDVQYVGLDKQATLQPIEWEQQETTEMVPGVEIKFLPDGESQPKTLYYFSTDLSNSGLAATPEFVTFVEQMNQPITYLKAASYLMHYESFTQIRDLILAQSSAVLQDDSGIPLRHFQPSNWELSFYGTYISPIQLFAEFYQPDLRQVYQTGANIEPLDFGIGYKFYNDSNLMLAIEAEGTENTEETPETTEETPE